MPVVVCSECEAKLNVPDNVVGKKIRCKACSAIFVAKASAPKPVAAVKKEVKKAPAAEPSKGVKNAAQPDPDQDGSAYSFDKTAEDDTLPRCPHCAKELSAENVRICLNCGYDTVLRTRNRLKAVYQPTFGEWFIHLLPGIAAALTVIAIITGCVLCILYMKYWVVGSLMEAEGSNPEKRIWNVNPGIINLWTCVFSAFICWKLGQTAYKRLVVNYQPKENKIKED